MTATIHVLDLGSCSTDWSFSCRGRVPGTETNLPIYGFLIKGASERPILVDTGFRDPIVLTRLGFGVEWPDGTRLEQQLADHDLELGDLGMVVMTHLHIDHAGAVDRIPSTVPLVVNRRELEFAAGGSWYPGYAQEDLQATIDRIYQPDGIRLMDLGATGPIAIADGVTCENTGGHTPGSMSIRVKTGEGVANICGDVVYDAFAQLVERPGVLAHSDPQTSNNFCGAALDELAAVKRALNGTDFLLPSHDDPWQIRDGAVVARIDGGQVPGAGTPVDETTKNLRVA